MSHRPIGDGFIEPSSNGKTPDFGSGNRGSNPRGSTNDVRVSELVLGDGLQNRLCRFKSCLGLDNGNICAGSSVGLEHMSDTHEVEGSIPSLRTNGSRTANFQH